MLGAAAGVAGAAGAGLAAGAVFSEEQDGAPLGEEQAAHCPPPHVLVHW